MLKFVLIIISTYSLKIILIITILSYLHHILRCGVEKMKIKIGDKNDNSPIMAEKRINVSFREDLEIGTKLFQVNAIDHDEPAGYGEITYRLENPNSYYHMDSKTGEVFIEHGFDYETEKSDEVSFSGIFCEFLENF